VIALPEHQRLHPRRTCVTYVQHVYRLFTGLLLLASYEEFVQDVVRFVEIEDEIQFAHIAEISIEHLHSSRRCACITQRDGSRQGAQHMRAYLNKLVNDFQRDQLVICLVHWKPCGCCSGGGGVIAG